MDNTQQKTEKFIDIEEVFRSKNPTLLKFIPRFIISYLKKIIHQDELNFLLSKNKEVFGLDFVEEALFNEMGVNLISEGLGNISPKGRYIIAANHPLGGLDGLALMHLVGKVRKDLIFPVNDILMNLPNLKELFIPINKHGSNVENVKIINDTFASEVLMLYFPAGFVSRKISGKITDLSWKKTFISKAKRFKRDIIPVYINGQNSNFFYKLANIRKNLGIKAKIEMLYLVNEMYKQKGKTLTLCFGNPIPYQTFDKRMPDAAWAELVKQHVYQLKNNPELVFNY